MLVVSALPTWINSEREREGESKREKEDKLLVINSKPQIYFQTGMGESRAWGVKEDTDIM